MTPPPKAFPTAVANSRPPNTEARAALVRSVIAHGKNCRRIMAAYQSSCGADDLVRKRTLFNKAKSLVKATFGSLDAAKAFVTGLENEHPGRNTTTAMPLSQLEEFSERVRSQPLPEDTAKLADDLESLTACATGRRHYRMTCEPHRDAGHDAAHWIFKVAAAIARVVEKEAP